MELCMPGVEVSEKERENAKIIFFGWSWSRRSIKPMNDESFLVIWFFFLMELCPALRSPLRKYFPEGKQINDGPYPDTFDFYDYPSGDILQDFYE